MKIIPIIFLILAGLAVLGWLGLKIQPASFPAFPQKSGTVETVPLPAGLPAPVERFYRTTYGDRIPVITSVVVTGRGKMRPFSPFYFPARFRFSHVAGQSYRHYIEITLFGFPLMKVNERYLEGKSLFEAPVGVIDNDPKQNQGANLGMWAESVWFPALYLTDPRVRWEAVDEATALLVVPFEATEERYVVRFDPDSGLITYLESMRYQGPESPSKILWLNESVDWTTVDGITRLKKGAAIWITQREPWAIFDLEEIVYNVDIREYIRQKGP